MALGCKFAPNFAPTAPMWTKPGAMGSKFGPRLQSVWWGSEGVGAGNFMRRATWSNRLGGARRETFSDRRTNSLTVEECVRRKANLGVSGTRSEPPAISCIEWQPEVHNAAAQSETGLVVATAHIQGRFRMLFKKT